MARYLLLSVYITLIIRVESSTNCADITKQIPEDKLATKTGYFSAKKNLQYKDAFEQESKGCTEEKVWFMSRHGTRYPATSDIGEFELLPEISETIVYNHFHGRGCLSEEDVFELKQWLPYYEPRDKGQLHATGAEELYSIGEHWKNMFPTIFNDPYDSSKIKVEFTIRNRTGQSAYHFLRGMYGDDAIGKIKLPKPINPNLVLRFHKACPKWEKEVYRNNETTYRERNLFKQTKIFQDMVERISSLLGFLKPLTIRYLTAIYDECRYETAWFPNKESIWCKPFSPKDIEVLEYYEDLKYYYEDSYGTPLNAQIACKAVSDLFLHLKTKVDRRSSLPNGVLYFTHDKAILKIQALLGLFKPLEPLKHDNLDPARIFKSSIAAPFATNLGFALYRCDGNGEPESYKVATFFEGFPIPFERVCSSILCPWEDYRRFLQPILEHCDFNKLCRVHDEL
ncbi:UNVERIFIED_CONTAM: hypothetical protein RMT77_017137 [Armadillidium vulgare]